VQCTGSNDSRRLDGLRQLKDPLGAASPRARPEIARVPSALPLRAALSGYSRNKIFVSISRMVKCLSLLSGCSSVFASVIANSLFPLLSVLNARASGPLVLE